MNKLKVMTILGTRPEIIRLSRTMALLDQHVDHKIVHTGQNYDYELNEIFWNELELRKPDYFLEINKESLGAAVGDVIKKSEEVLKQEKPDAVLVLGDTNSCLAAYMAKRMHIPIFHMEAGNRCFDENVPEETNRRIIDHIADFNLVYTEHARRHLLSEGLPHRRIYLTGSPMKEVLDHYLPKIERSDVLERLKLSNGKYFLVSAHREENVDNPENLAKILNILNRLAKKYELPVIVSTHPRTRKRLESLSDRSPEPSAPRPEPCAPRPEPHALSPEPSALSPEPCAPRPEPRALSPEPSALSPEPCAPRPEPCAPRPEPRALSPVPSALISFQKPFGFIDYVKLQMNALCTISDSGTISEESAILGFPAISLRNSMERPEAQDAGTIILTGFEPDIVLQSIDYVTKERKQNTFRSIPADYQVPDTSKRVLKLILGNTKLSNFWNGIRESCK